jgi:ribosomal protein L37AE/L43A
VFNYYNRIARFASDLEKNGKEGRAEQLREILKSENRCLLCGNLKVNHLGVWLCDKCDKNDKMKFESDEDFTSSDS